VKPRPSRLALHFKCPGSLSLEAIERSSDEAEAGKNRHAWLAEHPRIGLDAVGVDTEVYLTEHRVEFAGIEGTVDLLVDMDTADSLVIDYKSAGEDKGSPADSPQLLFYAHATGSKEVAFVYVEDSGPDGECRVRYARRERLSPTALQDFDSRLSDLIEGPNDTFVTGSHCNHCPGATSCPAIRNEVALALDSPLAVLSVQSAAQAWERMKAVRAACDIAEEAIKRYAAHTPVTLPNGKTIQPTETSRETINPEKALRIFPQLKEVAELGLTKKNVLAVVGMEGLVRLRSEGAAVTKLSMTVKES
jgi:hypothetical protein